MVKPKVLFILHFPPPVNGASMVGEYIKNSEVIDETFEADFVNLTASFSLKNIGKGGFGKILTILKILKKVFLTLKSKDYDLCYMTLTAKGAGFYKDFLIVVLLKMFRKKIVFHFHNKGVLKSSVNKLNNFLYSYTFKNTNSIVLSASLSYDIEKYVHINKIHICANGIPKIEENLTSNITATNNKDICRFLFLSNMMEEKGVMILLEALGQLKNRKVKFECHFIGAWSDISEIDFNTIVEEYKLSNYVSAHGKKYGDEKNQYFLNSDVFVFPTFYHNECFPLVLLEAMQYSLPIISTPEGGIVDLVSNGETGVLVEQKNVKELTDQLELMSENVILRQSFGKAGRRRYEELFTLSKFEKDFSTILNSIVANN